MMRLSFILPFILLLVACEKVIVSRTGVSVDTNAFYTAYQKDPTSSWKQINYNNDTFILETVSFTVEEENDPYAVVFVCPSKRRDLPNDVFVYYATAAEMSLVDFRCRKPSDEISTRPVYGKIGGVKSASLSNPHNPQGELVHMALSSTVSLVTLEAYAANIAIGRRDAVAYKGKQSATGNFVEQPDTFFIARGFTAGLFSDSQKADLGFGESFTGYTAPFKPESLSTVQLTGQSETDDVSTELNFLSSRKSLLNLVKTNQPTFSFMPIPLDKFTGADIGGFFNQNEFNPGEGHELHASVMSSAGKVEREVRKFFTLSDAQSHTINLPKKIDFTPALSLVNNGKYQFINTSWSEYNDSASGKTELYRWIFEGASAKLAGGAKSAVGVTKVRWSVYITPGWMSKVSRTPGSFSLTLPTKYETDVTFVVRDEKRENVWSDDWSFQENTPVDWELTAFTASEKASAGDVIEYLQNRNFAENYSFTEAYFRSSASPPPSSP